MLRAGWAWPLRASRAFRATAPAAYAEALRGCAGTSAARPPRSSALQRRPGAGAVEDRRKGTGNADAAQANEEPVRYGPLDVDLKPRDQLRPLLPTWNPPPTRPPRPEELEVSTRLRFRLEDRWWAATVREVSEEQVKVGYDGWPSRHDEWVPRDSDRLYLHESTHPDYEAPPLPQRYQRPVATDAEGNSLPPTPRPPRPRAYDPEKERLKRALRPPLPYNPEKERLKRLLRGQSAPPIESQDHKPFIMPSFGQDEQQQEAEQATSSVAAPRSDSRGSGPGSVVAPAATGDARSGGRTSSPEARDVEAAPSAASPAASPAASMAASPAAATAEAAVVGAASSPAQAAVRATVQWIEVPGGVEGSRAFRNAASGEVVKGPPPSGWVELTAGNGMPYYWHVDRQVTQWERPQ